LHQLLKFVRRGGVLLGDFLQGGVLLRSGVPVAAPRRMKVPSNGRVTAEAAVIAQSYQLGRPAT